MGLLTRLVPALLLLCASLAAAADPAIERITQKWQGDGAEDVAPSPIPGLYEMRIGQQIVYVSADGRYVLQGELFDTDQQVNLTEERLGEVRLDAIDAIGESSMIIFEPDGPAAHTLTVFTDIDCGYCRKLHREIADYNERGFRVRYLFFPRSGPDTESWAKADKVWCADDRNDALTRSKRGEYIDSTDCGATPTRQHYELGRSFGIRGTPAIVTDTGQLIPGYVSAPELKKELDNQQKAQENQARAQDNPAQDNPG